VHTVLAGDIAAKSVAITGCGPIGLFSIAVARACGATQIFALEVNEHRRKIAKQMGPDFVLDPTKDDVYQIVMDNTGGTGVDVVLEMAGRTEAIRTGFKILRLGGRMSLLGIPSRPVELNLARPASGHNESHRHEGLRVGHGAAEDRRGQQDSGVSGRDTIGA
jgi:threonine 3-dehydrogenase